MSTSLWETMMLIHDVLHGVRQLISKVRWLVLSTLVQVQGGIFHLSFGLLDALSHVIRAVALTPFEYFLEVPHSGLSHDVYPLGSISSICHHPSIIELPSILVSQVCHQLNYLLLFCPFGSYQMCWK